MEEKKIDDQLVQQNSDNNFIMYKLKVDQDFLDNQICLLNPEMAEAVKQYHKNASIVKLQGTNLSLNTISLALNIQKDLLEELQIEQNIVQSYQNLKKAADIYKRQAVNAIKRFGNYTNQMIQEFNDEQKYELENLGKTLKKIIKKDNFIDKKKKIKEVVSDYQDCLKDIQKESLEVIQEKYQKVDQELYEVNELVKDSVKGFSSHKKIVEGSIIKTTQKIHLKKSEIQVKKQEINDNIKNIEQKEKNMECQLEQILKEQEEAKNLLKQILDNNNIKDNAAHQITYQESMKKYLEEQKGRQLSFHSKLEEQITQQKMELKSYQEKIMEEKQKLEGYIQKIDKENNEIALLETKINQKQSEENSKGSIRKLCSWAKSQVSTETTFQQRKKFEAEQEGIKEQARTAQENMKRYENYMKDVLESQQIENINQLRDLENQIKDTNGQVKAVYQEVKKQDQFIKTSQNEVSQAQNQIDYLNKKITDQEETIHKLKNNKTQLETYLKVQKNQLQTQENEKQQLEENLRNFFEMIQQLNRLQVPEEILEQFLLLGQHFKNFSDEVTQQNQLQSQNIEDLETVSNILKQRKKKVDKKIKQVEKIKKKDSDDERCENEEEEEDYQEENKKQKKMMKSLISKEQEKLEELVETEDDIKKKIVSLSEKMTKIPNELSDHFKTLKTIIKKTINHCTDEQNLKMIKEF